MLSQFDGKQALDNIEKRYKFEEIFSNESSIAELDTAEKCLKLNNIPDLNFPIDLRETLFK